jgi:hypothetical protein
MSSGTFETGMVSPQQSISDSRLDVVTITSDKVFSAIDHGKVFTIDIPNSSNVFFTLPPAITCVGVRFKVLATGKNVSMKVHVSCSIETEARFVFMSNEDNLVVEARKNTQFSFKIGSCLEVTCTGKIWHFEVVSPQQSFSHPRLDAVTLTSDYSFSSIDHGKVFTIDIRIGSSIFFTLPPAITCVGVQFKILALPLKLRVHLLCTIEKEALFVSISQESGLIMEIGKNILFPRVNGAYFEVTCTGKFWHVETLSLFN